MATPAPAAGVEVEVDVAATVEVAVTGLFTGTCRGLPLIEDESCSSTAERYKMEQ